MDAKTREILEKVERGELTPEEGAALMAGTARTLPLETQPEPPSPGDLAVPGAIPVGGTPPPAPTTGPAEGTLPPAFAAGSGPSANPEPEVVEDFHSLVGKWKNWWVIPLWAGTGVFVLGAIWMAWGNYSQHLFWFYCGIFPLLLGLGVMLLALWSRRSRWLHVRVKSDKGDRHDRVAISMPLPTHLVGWIFKTFGGSIPGLREQPEVIRSMPEIMAALGQNGDPLIVEVNEKNGDEVRVYIM